MNVPEGRGDTPPLVVTWRRWKPTRWALWSQRRRVVALVIAVHVATAVVTTAVVVDAPTIDSDQWWRFGLLTLCAVVHLYGSRRIERERRDRTVSPHIDLNSVWSIAAVLVLHPLLMLVLIGVLRLARWFIARRPPFRFLFSSASHLLSAMLAAAVLRQLGVPSMTASSWDGSVVAVAIVAVAALTYFVVQLGLVAAVILLSSSNRTRTSVLGTADVNALEMATICMGCLAGLALAQAPLLLVLMVPVALVIHRTVLIRQLRAAADHDAKTGLLNLPGWRTRAERELARADRQHHPLGVLVIDLDHFKQVNDRYGHLAGDRVLSAVADTLIAETREYDLVGRLGGEEFVILLPIAGQDATLRCGDRIRHAISQLAVPVEQSNAGTVVIDGLTASIGACCYPTGATSLDDLVRRADNALFAAKDSGRDQVHVVKVD